MVDDIVEFLLREPWAWMNKQAAYYKLLGKGYWRTSSCCKGDAGRSQH